MQNIWNNLSEARLFISGGTGFFGKWLLTSILQANKQLNLNLRATVLSRNPARFLSDWPEFNNPAFKFISGDIADFEFPKEPHTHIIHAATEASVKLNNENPAEMLRVTTSGTKHILNFAKACGATHFLLTSSGAVYGNQPPTLMHTPETLWEGCTNLEASAIPESAYAQGKRESEVLCTMASQNSQLQCKIARCYAFLGPHLPLDTHFAAGNFLRDALNKRTIQIGGDGTPYRSYMYPVDLIDWLITILVNGKPNRPYNVGSDEPVSIAELANAIAAQTGVDVAIAKKPTPGILAPRYVPSIERAKNELGLKIRFGLEESIRLTLQWLMRRR